jgi:hypothetical protein
MRSPSPSCVSPPPDRCVPAVVVRLIEIAGESGLERVVTYARVDNPSFMRFFLRLGFAPSSCA